MSGKSNPVIAFVVDGHTMCSSCAYNLFFSVKREPNNMTTVQCVLVSHERVCPICKMLMSSHEAMQAAARISSEMEA